jgi:hypothetical protein
LSIVPTISRPPDPRPTRTAPAVDPLFESVITGTPV